MEISFYDMDIQIAAHKFYDYSNFIRGYSPHTIRRYRNSINYYCKFANVTRCDQITEGNVRAMFFHGRTELKWQSNSFLTIHKSLLVFFRWAVEQGYMLKNLAENIEKPKLEKRLPKKLTKQESFRLLEIIYNYPYDSKFLHLRNHAIFSMFIFAGLRKSELLKLRLTDIDIENLTIFINQGKGSKDRTIPMSTTLAQSLKRYLEERRCLKKTCPELFASLIRNMGLTDIGLKRLVHQIRKASRLKFTIHNLRHTFATLMLEGGCDIYSLSRMMGHSNIQTTTIYLSASVEHLRKQIVKHPLEFGY